MTNYGIVNAACPLCDLALSEVVLDVSKHIDTYLEHLNQEYQLGAEKTRFYYECLGHSMGQTILPRLEDHGRGTD